MPSLLSTASPPTLSSGPIGVFGGTFDPVHLGHLRLAQEALDHLALAQIRWIPAGQPPHRPAPPTTPQQRLDMVALATAQQPAFLLDPSEILSQAASYTVHTLERLRSELGPSRPLVLLVGADAFAGLASWFRWQDILTLAHLGIAHRPGYSIKESELPRPLAAEFQRRHRNHPAVLNQSAAGKMVSFSMTQLDISATQIRHLHRQHQSVRYLLPDCVLDYIDQHQLYK
jgi:nicotinate-nucleotide adenylyltransferase